MGSGALRFRLCTHSDMKQILVTLLLLGALLAVTEGKRRGGKPKKARSGRGGERSWHIAGEEGHLHNHQERQVVGTQQKYSPLRLQAACAQRPAATSAFVPQEVTWKMRRRRSHGSTHVEAVS